jgi:hypothetical protein
MTAPVAIPCWSWIGATESSIANSVPSRRRRTQFGVSPTVLFSEDGVMENKSSEGIAQHYTLPRIVLANVVLDPSLRVAA